MQGKIIKGIAGFYYVHIPRKGIYECKARGLFRKDNQKPLVGDNCIVDELDDKEKLGTISELLPRNNALIRPAVANVDQALVIFSIVSPRPNFNLLDRFLVMMGREGIPCIICFNKTDMDAQGQGGDYERIYQDCGYRCLVLSARSGQGMAELSGLLTGKTTTVAGPSGVGKSTIINALQSEVVMATNTLSRKIDRGRHTTRHTEIISLKDGAYILDTPGFSSLGLFLEDKEELKEYYPEFEAFASACRFKGCVHRQEPDCGVKEALEKGLISRLRYENYCTLFDEIKNTKRY